MKITEVSKMEKENVSLIYKNLRTGDAFTMFDTDTPRVRTTKGHVAFQKDGLVVSYGDTSFEFAEVTRIDAELKWCRR